MKSVFLFFFLVNSILSVTAQSFENPGTPEQRASKMTTQMTTDLQLDTSQVQNIQKLNLKYAKIAQTEILDKNLGVWAMYRQGIRLNKQKEKELKPLLRPVQWKKYEQLKTKTMLRIWEHLF